MNTKTKDWIRVRKELVKEFEDMGIVTCEARLPGCWHDNALGFAHTRKRRNVTDLKRVSLLCQPCHSRVEYFCKEATGMDMETYLEGIIAKRVDHKQSD